MKCKIGVLCLMLIWCCVWGRPYYSQALSVIKYYKSISTEMLQSTKAYEKSDKDVKALRGQITQLNSQIDVTDKVALSQSIAAIDGVDIISISAKRLNGTSNSVTIATVTNVDDVANFTDTVDCMEFTLQVSSVEQTITQLESLHLCYETLDIIKADNTIVVSVLTI